MMLLAYVFSCLVFQTSTSGGQAGPAKPVPDRRGEPELRRLFEDVSKLKHVFIVIDQSSQETSRFPMYPDGQSELWFEEAGKFRLEFADTWGDGVLYVSDGKTLLRDSLSEDTPATLSNATPEVYRANPDLALRGDYFSPMYYMLSGVKTFDLLVDKDAAILQLPAKGIVMRVQFNSKTLGLVTVSYVAIQKRLVPTRFQYDLIPWKKQQFKTDPENNDDPIDPLTCQWITVLPMPSHGRSWFEPKPAKGRQFEDRRRKGIPTRRAASS